MVNIWPLPLNFLRPEIFMIAAMTLSLQRTPAFSVVLTPSRKAQLVRGKVVLMELSRMVWRWL